MIVYFYWSNLQKFLLRKKIKYLIKRMECVCLYPTQPSGHHLPPSRTAHSRRARATRATPPGPASLPARGNQGTPPPRPPSSPRFPHVPQSLASPHPLDLSALSILSILCRFSSPDLSLRSSFSYFEKKNGKIDYQQASPDLPLMSLFSVFFLQRIKKEKLTTNRI